MEFLRFDNEYKSKTLSVTSSETDSELSIWSKYSASTISLPPNNEITCALLLLTWY